MSSSQMMSDFEKQPEKINLKEIWFKVLSNWKLLLAIFAIFKGGQNIEFLCLTDFWRISDALQAFGVAMVVASSTAVEYFQMSEFVQYARLSHVLVGNGVPSASTSSDQLGLL